MVEVDWPVKALSMHTQTPYWGKIVLVRIAVILSKIFFKTKLLHSYVQCVYIVYVKYQIADQKLC